MGKIIYIYMDLCKYKNSLGEPGKGIHSYRFFGIAIADVIMTIIAGYLIAYFFKLSIAYTIIFLFILGIILHRLFCVRTTVDKLLFPNVKD
jgi:uncharacterized membrane protein